MKDSTALLNEIAEHRDRVRELAEKGDVEGARYESGVADTLQSQLSDAIAYEKDLLVKEVSDVAWTGDGEDRGRKGAKGQGKTMAEIVMGPRDRFEGIPADRSMRVPVDYAVDLPDPERVETGWPTTEVEPMGFLGTIGRGTTDAQTNVYPQKAPDTNRLVLDIWRKGERKREHGLSWRNSTFYTEWIAGLMVVSEATLRNYGVMESIMRTELYNGLERAQHYYAVHGDYTDDQPGIAGILSPRHGIKTFTPSSFSGDTILDTYRRMATRVLYGSGRVPELLCVNPFLREAMDLLKVGEGRNDYLGLTINGDVWGLRIVDDVYFADFDDEATAKNAYAMIYSPGGATWFTQHGPEFVMERMGEQLAYNETTMRLEGSYGLKVSDPTAFMLAKFEINDYDKDLKDRMAPRPRPRDVEVVRYDGDFLDQAGIEAVELGDFAVSGTTLYGEANLVYVPKYGSDDGQRTGYFCCLRVPTGTKVKKDSGSEQTLQASDCGLWGVKLGDKSGGITAKKLQYTLPGEEAPRTLNIKVTAATRTAHQGGRVRQS